MIYQRSPSFRPQADAARAAARDAFRADPKNSSKSGEWHSAVQRAGQLQERMRAAREGATRAQALAELLQGEAARRGLQVRILVWLLVLLQLLLSICCSLASTAGGAAGRDCAAWAANALCMIYREAALRPHIPPQAALFILRERERLQRGVDG